MSSKLQGVPRTEVAEGRIGPPVFVIGVARSGTTITYSTLLASGSFPIYETEGRLMECSQYYGSLSSRHKRRRFLRDFLESRQFHRSGLDEAEVVDLVENRAKTFEELLDVFMASLCRSQGKSRWAEKSPNNSYFVRELSRLYPDSKFVHVVRDGRAVVLSQRKLGWSEKYTHDPRKQLIWIGSHWDLMVGAGRQAAELGTDRYLELRYEDLIGDMPRTLDKLGRFVGVDLTMEMLTGSEIGTLSRPNSAFGSERRGISDDSLNRWRTELDPSEIALLSWQLRDRLMELGYDVDAVPAEARISIGDRVIRRLSRAALVGQQLLNHHTPVGRLARKPPLEIGLS